MPVLFIYGTLKRGDCRHSALSGQTFLGEVRTLPKYQMIDLGEYPGLIEVERDGMAIEGELWEVSASCLVKLDQIECLDEGLYARRVIELTDTEIRNVECYFYLLNTAGRPKCGPRWKPRPSAMTDD